MLLWLAPHFVFLCLVFSLTRNRDARIATQTFLYLRITSEWCAYYLSLPPSAHRAELEDNQRHGKPNLHRSASLLFRRHP
jgi:hypothetical protein